MDEVTTLSRSTGSKGVVVVRTAWVAANPTVEQRMTEWPRNAYYTVCYPEFVQQAIRTKGLSES